MHVKTALRSHPVLLRIEPALTGNQIAYLDETQQAVIVAPQIGQTGQTQTPNAWMTRTSNAASRALCEILFPCR